MGIDVNLVLSAEMLRDGGSLSISFQGSDSCEYMLVFPVKKFGKEPVEYSEPVLVNRTTGIELDVGWENAGVYLNQLQACAENEDHINFIMRMLNNVNVHT